MNGKIKMLSQIDISDFLDYLVDYIEDNEDTDTIYWLLAYLIKQVTSYDEESCDVNILKSLKLLKATKSKLKPAFLFSKHIHEDKSDKIRFKKGDLVRFNLPEYPLEVVGTFIGMFEGKKQVQLEDESIHIVNKIYKI